MAQKEVTVFVVDVGKSTGLRHEGQQESFLDSSLRYVFDKIASSIAGGRKTLQSGVVAFRANETDNELAEDDEAYANIQVLKQPSQLMMSDMRDLRKKLQPSSTNQGDAMSALVVALDIVGKFFPGQKWSRKIVLVTDARGPIDSENLDDISGRAQQLGVAVTIVGPNAAADEQSEDQKEVYANVATLVAFAEHGGMQYGSVDEVVKELSIPQVKLKKSAVGYRGPMTLGNPAEYDSAMAIDVERYIKTDITKPPSASTYVVGKDADQSNVEASNIKLERSYKVKDEEGPGGYRDVAREDLARGYEYGQTAVAIGESEQTVTQLETKACFDIVGFIPKTSAMRYMDMSRCSVTIAQKFNPKAIMALSSFIHTLYELEYYAVARLVVKAMKPPDLIMLAPHVEPDFECLLDVVLPFAEDIRPYRFPPLDRIVTVSGKNVVSHRNLPSAELCTAMDDYVDAMDLTFDDGTEDGAQEYAAVLDTFSPALHRTFQTVAAKAIDPDAPVQEPLPELIKYSRPPEDLVSKNEKLLAAIRRIADLKKVPPRSFGRHRKQREDPVSGLDVGQLLQSRSKQNKQRIDPQNAIAEFKQMLNASDKDEVTASAFEQMGTIVDRWLSDSFGDAQYERAIEGIGTMRREAIEYELPQAYNGYVSALRAKIAGDQLNGDRRDFWLKVRQSRLGLIAKTESERSTTDEATVKSFYVLP